MYLRAKMMLGVVAVIKPDPIVKFVVATYSPGNRFIRVPTVMPIVTIEIGKTVAKIPAGKKKTNVMPVQNT